MKPLRSIVQEGFRDRWRKAADNPSVRDSAQKFGVAAKHLGIQLVAAPLAAATVGDGAAMSQGRNPLPTAAVVGGGVAALGAAASLASGTSFRTVKHGLSYVAKRAYHAATMKESFQLKKVFE